MNHVRVIAERRFQSIESASYRLEDLKSGVVKVSVDAKYSTPQPSDMLFPGLSCVGSVMVSFYLVKLDIDLYNTDVDTQSNSIMIGRQLSYPQFISVTSTALFGFSM